MKKIIFNILITLLLVNNISCNDSFLERTPTNDLNDNYYWNTAEDLKVYVNGIFDLMADNDRYRFYTGYGNRSMWSANASFLALEAQTDNLASSASEHTSFLNIAAGKETIPTSAASITSTGTVWRWDMLRNCNLFLANYKKADIPENLKNYFAGEVYFMRAWFYLDKVQQYGDVPYISIPLDTASPELYGERKPRKAVMDSVLTDINKAVELLPEVWSGEYPDRINKYMAMALKSRICLYEGTFRKYHNLGDHEQYLKDCVDISKELMDTKKFDIHNTGNPESDYRSVFINTDLASNKEAIMVRKYNALYYHKLPRYLVELKIGVTQDLVEDFLCIEADKSAKPVRLSSTFNDDNIDNVFKNRDPRLRQVVLAPEDEEKIYRTSRNYPKLLGMTGVESTTGYHFIKYYSFDQDASNVGDTDAPIIRYAEILLNYAEAKYELGTLTADDLKISINLLRKRAGLPDLTLTPPMDPKYANEGIDPLLVEIRRERRVELCFEQHRYQDLMRWKKGPYLAKKVLGMRFEESDKTSDRYKGANVSTVPVGDKNYIDVYAGSNYGDRVFDEKKHYYHPIPLDEVALNPKLEQTEGWK